MVNPYDMWILLIDSVRYSMGRMSTAPSTCQDCIRAYEGGLTVAQLKQIRDEISEELRWREEAGKFLGHKCDHETWRETVAILDAAIQRRRITAAASSDSESTQQVR